jgi:hypothetical protein
MVGISDYRPIRIPNGAVELRVHGVSGTPPEALLKTPAVLVAGTPTAGFHRQYPSSEPMTAESPGVREGYAWGGLTSGSRITSALRLLLLPFSLVNVAGWMLPGATAADGAPTRPSDTDAASARAAIHALVSRLLAVCLTAYITLGAMWVSTAAIKEINAKYAPAVLTSVGAQVRASMFAVIALIVVWVAVAHRRASTPADAASAPDDARVVARAPVAAPAQHGVAIAALWEGSVVGRRLSGIHAAIAIACAALITAAALGSNEALVKTGVGLAVASVVLGVLGIVALVDTAGWSRRLMTVVRFTAIPSALLGAALVLTPRVTATEQAAMLKNVGRSLGIGMAALAVAVFVLVIAQVVAGPRRGPRIGRLYASAFTVIGFGTAITGISGLAVTISYVLSDRNSAKLVEGLAQTIAIVGLISCCVFLIVVLLRFNPTAKPLGVPWFERLRDTTAHAREAIVIGACTFALGANAVALMYLVTDDVIPPWKSAEGEVGWAAAGWFVLGAVVAAIAAARLTSWGVRVITTVVGGIVLTFAAWIGAAGVSAWLNHEAMADEARRILGESDRWFVIVAVLAALVTPMAAVIGYMWRGSKDHGTRRLVGVVWDLVNFWPRQFHPWAPPPYTDTTIPELAERVRHLATTSGATSVIVSAHSQGAIIAVPALSRLNALGQPAQGTKDQPSAQISLLTYGQLLDSHYRWLFPWVFNPDVFRDVNAYLNDRWINLYRVTDPLGQPVRAIDELDPARDRKISEGLTLNLGAASRTKTLNHGDYWYSREVYEPALEELAASPVSARRRRWSRRDASSGTDPTPPRA